MPRHSGLAGRTTSSLKRRRSAHCPESSVGLYTVLTIYPYFREWQQRQADKTGLAKMRKHYAARASMRWAESSVDRQVAEQSTPPLAKERQLPTEHSTGTAAALGREAGAASQFL
jgi:hypothetical protein